MPRKELSDAAVELQLYIDNNNEPKRSRSTGKFYLNPYATKLAIQKNLATRRASGTYRHDLAPKAFVRLIDTAAKAYADEYSSSERDWSQIFDREDRTDLANYFVAEFEVEDKLGNFDHLLPKKYQKQAHGGGGSNMTPALPYYARGGGGATSGDVGKRQLINNALTGDREANGQLVRAFYGVTGPARRRWFTMLDSYDTASLQRLEAFARDYGTAAGKEMADAINVGVLGIRSVRGGGGATLDTVLGSFLRKHPSHVRHSVNAWIGARNERRVGCRTCDKIWTKHGNDFAIETPAQFEARLHR